MSQVDPIETERQRLAKQRVKVAEALAGEDPIARVRRERAERRARVVSRQDEHMPRDWPVEVMGTFRAG